jgi:lysine 2,3-aminomutase
MLESNKLSKEIIDMTRDKMNEDEMSKELMEKWSDWKWQVSRSITEINTVEKIFGTKFRPEFRAEIEKTIEKFPMSITPYYLSLVDVNDYENDPVFRQAFPSIQELHHSNYDMEDPLHEEVDSPVLGITHRYPDRVLFHVSNVCSMYCRHCTRKRKVGDVDSVPSKDVIDKGIEYIKNHPEIRDVLLSGGDPFLLSNEYLDYILSNINEIDHVKVVRIGTRTPVVLPQRINQSLLDVLKKYDNLWLNTHFNHPREITNSAKAALKKLSSIGIPLGNQSVLLRDVNDCPRIMMKLVHDLVDNRVRPYYMYQCDLSEGLEHFRTDVGKGIEIIESLRGHTSGFAVPTYVIDAPGGGGKIPVMPNYLISWSSRKVVLRNYEGVITTYNMPENYEHNKCDLNCESCNLDLKLEDEERNIVGIAKLLSDYEDEITITPENLQRRNRGN